MKGWIPRIVARGFQVGMVVCLGMSLARAEVRLELRIPPAETYVIGDTIPLNWRFSNLSTQALGFMWEGCCRLNGKLEVQSVAGSLPTFPPGQALAHMFAKADRLDPGVPKEYDTRVSDWIQLEASGSYQLKGTYRGVLPTQFPQVRPGLALWRDAAQSDPVSLKVITVAEYQTQRAAREQRRGLRLTLSGPDRLLPLQPMTFQVRLENSSTRPVPVGWPDDEALWVLDRHDRRVAPAAVLEGVTELVEIPASGAVERTFTLSADRFESEPLGDYSIFVDLREGLDGAPRVPSNRLPLSWKLEPDQVRDLVISAASGAGTGARNAPLKLLRVYLGELTSSLADLNRSTLSPEAKVLADRLSLAAALKPIAPKPGLVPLTLALNAQGDATWANPRIQEALGSGALTLQNQALQILGVRRHLGWEISLHLAPTDATPVMQVVRQLSEWKALSSDWATAPAVVMAMGVSNAPVQWRAAEAGVVLSTSRLEIGPAGRKWSPASESTTGSVTIMATDEVLRAYSGSGEIQVLVDREMSWGEMQKSLEPLLRPGRQFVVSLTPPGVQ